MSDEAQEVLVVPTGLESFVVEGDFVRLCAQEIESEPAKNGKIGGSVLLSAAGEIFGEQYVELPMELIFDRPMEAHSFE